MISQNHYIINNNRNFLRLFPDLQYISSGKKGYVIALRTGPGMRECERLIASIEHFYGHMEIECCDRMGLCSVEYKEDLECKKEELVEFCSKID